MPVEIFSRDAVRAIDRAAIDEAGIAGYTLMSDAAQAAMHECAAVFPGRRRWQVLCGTGNNAGDGYVLARLAAESGIKVSVLSLGDPLQLTGDAARAYADLVHAGLQVQPWAGRVDYNADLFIDALFGSGLGRPVEGVFAEAIAALNAGDVPVVALDIPSGINGDTGDCMGIAVRAALTVTFVGLKAGLFLGEGIAATGELRFAGLGIPDSCREGREILLQRIDEHSLHRALPPRPRDAHKGDFGHVLVVGGGKGMPGAARLCAEAALRAGAGKVSVATWPAHAAALTMACPELIVHGVDAADDLQPLFESASVIAFGPGLGQSDWAQRLYAPLAQQLQPAVWDADALNLLAKQQRAGTDTETGQRVLTPHPGEAGRLLNVPAAAIQRERLASVQSLQRTYGGVAVLKGARTLVAAGEPVPEVCTAGNPGMAAPGMGDVLTGIIAAFLAQGLVPRQAAALAVLAHACAGDRAARRGERGLLASDLLGELRAVINGVVT